MLGLSKQPIELLKYDFKLWGSKSRMELFPASKHSILRKVSRSCQNIWVWFIRVKNQNLFVLKDLQKRKSWFRISVFEIMVFRYFGFQCFSFRYFTSYFDKSLEVWAPKIQIFLIFDGDLLLFKTISGVAKCFELFNPSMIVMNYLVSCKWTRFPITVWNQDSTLSQQTEAKT